MPLECSCITCAVLQLEMQHPKYNRVSRAGGGGKSFDPKTRLGSKHQLSLLSPQQVCRSQQAKEDRAANEGALAGWRGELAGPY